MSAPHERYRDDVAALLLGALSDLERQALEHHLEGCAECREAVERLRPAVAALARSVDQVEAPATLKAELMRVVGNEASERDGRAARSPLSRWAGGLVTPVRRVRLRAAPAIAVGALVVGIAAGLGVSQLLQEDERTVTAKVDTTRVPSASGELELEGDGEDGGILRVEGLPELPAGRVYQAWVIAGKDVTPQPTFEVAAGREGVVAVPGDLSGADVVAVTREPRGGSPAPTETPLLQVPL